MKWEGIGFTVELVCGQRVYMGTLGEIAQREAVGIYGPDPCAEVEEDMSARADLTGVDGNVTESKGAEVRVANRQPGDHDSYGPDLTVGSLRAQLLTR